MLEEYFRKRLQHDDAQHILTVLELIYNEVARLAGEAHNLQKEEQPIPVIVLQHTTSKELNILRKDKGCLIEVRDEKYVGSTLTTHKVRYMDKEVIEE